jgi:three-Cys-motif partner protein
MATPKDTIWPIEPHTLAKHEILRRYLGAWFPILGKYHRHIIYIDGFCGPGKYTGGEPGSPIIALQEAAKQNTRLQQNTVTFLFNDEDPDRVAHLQHELGLLTTPRNFNIRVATGSFETQFRRLLDRMDAQGLQLVPTFAFIDPFGFEGVPFELVQRLLQNSHTEVFLNIMLDSVNRFLEHPNAQIRQHIVDLFGTPNVLKIANQSENRIRDLLLLYQRQLAGHAKFVRYFEMRNRDNRTVYYLFFATNHPLGHLKMKEAFWRVDPSSGFRFSDATNPNQLILFEVDESPKLAQQLKQRFHSQQLAIEDVRKFTEDETPFLRTHMRAALTLLEQQDEIKVKELKRDGKKRMANTFPDEVIITFPRK